MWLRDAFSVSSQEAYPHGLAFNTDGTKMFVSGYGGDNVNEYTLTTAFDVSTAVFNNFNGDGTGFSVAAQEAATETVEGAEAEAESLLDAAGDAVEAAADTVEAAAEAAGDAVEGAAEAAGDAVEGAAEAAEEMIK